MLCIAHDRGPTAPAEASHGAPRNKIQCSCGKSHPEPSTNLRHRCRSAGKVAAPPQSHPGAPIAAHQHTQILGLYFSSGLPRARKPQRDFPRAFQTHELARQRQRGKEERQNRTDTA